MVALLGCYLAVAGLGPGVATADSPIGAHSMLQLNDPYSFMQTMFAQAVGMGASSIRLDVAPALIFTAESQPPSFTGLDEVMALSSQYHLPVLADLFTIPAWMADCQTATDMPKVNRCGTDDLAAFGAMISQIVVHADPVIRDWEIWNEPDTSEFFTGTPQQYALMLRAAHDAIKAIDPHADVLLGGISGPAGMSWLAQVLTAPGADAAGAFDIAGVHERAWLDSLAPDIAAWRQFLAGYGFTGPLWVTEHGYPSDPAFQYSPTFMAGVASQAAYLTASIPTLIDAGASRVFVTERDNLGGQFASEGVLGGDVSVPPVADPMVIEKPAYGAVSELAGCYVETVRDCAGPAPAATPAATPAALTLPTTPLGSASESTVSVSDPGLEPLQLGATSLTGAGAGPLAVTSDGCSGHLLEPDQTCALGVTFTPSAGGGAAAELALASDHGSLTVEVNAVAPAVSSLSSPQLLDPAFAPTHLADGVGYPQRLGLTLTDPLSAPVQITGTTVSGPAARQFRIDTDHCAGTLLAPGGQCSLSVLFIPVRRGTESATLTMRGDGTPLSVALSATAFALPTFRVVASTARRPCFAPRWRNRVFAMTDQPALLSWQVVRQSGTLGDRCRGVAGAGQPTPSARRSSASGQTFTSAHRARAKGRTGYVTRFVLPLWTQAGRLRPGAYRLTITANNAHGAGRARATTVFILP